MCQDIGFYILGGDFIMKYSDEQIRAFADEHIRKLVDNEYPVESLPNNENLFYGELEDGYFHAVKTSNPSSRLFRATYED